jgi:glutathione synthase/RimK-type ligase-like ATP-grasp enzyme
MARKHWQVIQRHESGRKDEGGHQTLAVEQAPRQVVQTAVRAANLMGNGLYGVDLKQIDRKCYVIEVNDNPNIDAGVEDSVLKERLYLRIVEGFIRRIERQKGQGSGIERLSHAAAL